MTRTDRMSVLAIAAGLILLLAVPSANAYEIPDCYGDLMIWSTLTPNFYPIETSFPRNTVQRTALESAFNTWNYDSPGTRFRFNFSYTGSPAAVPGDGWSGVAFDANYGWDSTTLAVELSQYNKCYWLIGGAAMRESDILFNPNKSWDYSLTTLPADSNDYYSYSTYNFKLVAIHELGHGFGFTPHEDDILATNNSYYPNGGVLGNSNDVHPHADDIRGNRAAYGTCCTERDLAVSAYERSDPGEVDRIRPPATSYRGHTSSYRFTLENRGTTNESSVRVNFYLSPDRNVTTSDTYLGAATYSINSGVTATYNASVTVPTSLSPGNYYFGYVIDPYNYISEKDEGNNGVGHAIATNVPSASPPNACFSANPRYGYAPLDVSFDAGCSSDPVGSISSYHWDFGDGFTATGRTATRRYFVPGRYLVRLTVTDDTGLTDQATAWIDVLEDCPGQEICAPQ